MAVRYDTSPDLVQGRLLKWAALFIVCQAAALTLSPAVRARAWDVPYRWDHWLGVAVWLAGMALAHRETARRHPVRDPYLLPIAGLLSGWGLLTIWRLTPHFGLRQLVWLVTGLGVFIAGLRLPKDLAFLHRYKYLWLTSGLALTGLTLVFGTNPSGFGPRLWLGCCGVYLQPSEPLKLLLITYLAAYLAAYPAQLDVLPAPGRKASAPLLPLLAPTIIMTGLALLLLLVQRDLGTASLFVFIFMAVVYLATGQTRVVAATLALLPLIGLAGYALFDVVRLRIDAWLNPWLDPSGRSYQIVQSLISMAAGGVFGRGLGLGSPGLVPVAHSDFIFTALAEENGLVGALAVLLLVGLLLNRGLRLALHARQRYPRYLAAGLATHLAAQSILIIGGNLRLLPLTGVTLPFVSYGGSSLVTSFVVVLLLVVISSDQEPGLFGSLTANPRPYLGVGSGLALGLAAAAIVAGWWAVVRSPALLARTDNPRQFIADRYVPRGNFVDRRQTPLVVTMMYPSSTANAGAPGELTREVLYPALSPLLGYSSPIYGQAGLEAALDSYLRGLTGQPDPVRWENEFLYGQHPPGLDLRLSLDLTLQQTADALLGETPSALILLNSKTGEILALASHPYFDANTLEATWPELLQDTRAPLLNRVSQGTYPPGGALGPMLLAAALEQSLLPHLPGILTYPFEKVELACALPPKEPGWGGAVQGGCPGALAGLGEALGPDILLEVFIRLGLYTAPPVGMPTSNPSPLAPLANPALAAAGLEGPLVSPLQVAVAASTLNSGGTRPAPRLAMAVNLPGQGWVGLPPTGSASPSISRAAAEAAANLLAVDSLKIWETVALAQVSAGGNPTLTWYLGGTLPAWSGAPVTLVLVLETNDPARAQAIGRAVLKITMQP